MSNRRIVIRLKMCYTISVVLRLALCKAVCKADRHSEPMLAGIFPIGPDRKGVLFYQAFYIWWGLSIGKTQEMAAGFVHSGIIHLERMLPASSADHCMPGNDGAEVVYKEPGHSSISMYLRFLNESLMRQSHVSIHGQCQLVKL